MCAFKALYVKHHNIPQTNLTMHLIMHYYDSTVGTFLATEKLAVSYLKFWKLGHTLLADFISFYMSNDQFYPTEITF